MTDISLDQIRSLRDRTGISITACKKALVEAGGDVEKAIELLRKKGQAKAAERADRATSQGVVAIAQNGNKAAMIAVGCETDFVAKNDDFVNRVQELAEKVLAEGADVDLTADMSDLNIQMGEKVEVKEKVVVEGDQVSTYLHGNRRIGVLVSLSGANEEQGQDVAMHAAAMKPTTLSPNDIDDELVAKEREIWTEQLKGEGKPENIIENILVGKEKKFREEWALLTQPFVKDSSMTVEGYLGGATVAEFYRFEV